MEAIKVSIAEDKIKEAIDKAVALHPHGWTKGERIEIDKEKGNNARFFISQLSVMKGKVPKPDDIAFITFYTHKEISDWLEWWFGI